MKNELFYEEISSIVSRVSTRTLKMKTNNVKLLNKIGFELTHILSKMNDIVRLYQADKNEFINDVELIQRDYIDMSRKIDEKFTQNSESQSNHTAVQHSGKTQAIANQTNLQRILNTSNSSIDDSLTPAKTKKKKKKSRSPIRDTSHSDAPEPELPGLVVPDTCAFDYLPQKIATNSNIEQFVVRETIDSNYCLNNEAEMADKFESILSDLEKSQESVENIDMNSLQLRSKAVSMKKKLNKSPKKTGKSPKKPSSTPMSVRKKLQEHGLLDMTNDQDMSQTISPTQPCKKSAKCSAINEVSSPSLILKEPSTKNSKQNPSKKPLDKNTTPIKFLMLDRTPHKSPSLIFKSIADQSSRPAISSFESRNNKLASSKTGDTSSKLAKKLVTPSTDQSFTNQFDLYNEIPSPKKALQNSSKPAKKRLKQLTMSQAFAVKSTTPTKRCADPDETCLQSPATLMASPRVSFAKPGPTVKNEPMETEVVVPSRPSHVNNSCTSVLKQVKPEPTEKLSETSLEVTVAQPSTLENVDEEENDAHNEFFADFDKVPKKKDVGPGFKHVAVVRKHDDRKKLASSSCKECENYWNSLPEDKRPQRMDDLCRHRSKYQAPDTPEHYWSISFPTTQDCIDRGYGGVLVQNDRDDSIAARRPRRKRPLKLTNENKKKKTTDDVENNNNNDDYEFDFGEDD